ncbi:MAG: hypothetical protein JSV12_04460 [Candidatus Bathyarchaeota archaeon]|nr:MAG: hypothetical protein JSV12_04460 [Candidatus Bathyarchaeota archaeon]
MKRLAGLVLLVLGISLLLLSVLSFSRTDTVIEVSFVMKPIEKYGPYNNGTYHHTRVLGKSILMGELVVKGGSFNFTANGYNTLHLKNVFIDQNYHFLIDPADDLYTFTFDNSRGIDQCSIRFTLQEQWMNTFLLMPSFIGMLLMAIGISIELRQRRKGRRKVEYEYQAR